MNLEEINHILLETYMGYGIAGIQDGRIIAEVRDISAEREYVDKLIDLCNVQNAAPEHLKDVVEDYIID